MTPTPTSRAIQPTEKQITAAVIQAWKTLGLPNTLVASIPNMGARGQYGLTKGLPDLLVLSPGMPSGIGFIELKTERGKLSPAQEAFRDLCVIVDVEHRVVWCLDQALLVLADWGVIRKARAAA